MLCFPLSCHNHYHNLGLSRAPRISSVPWCVRWRSASLACRAPDFDPRYFFCEPRSTNSMIHTDLPHEEHFNAYTGNLASLLGIARNKKASTSPRAAGLTTQRRVPSIIHCRQPYSSQRAIHTSISISIHQLLNHLFPARTHHGRRCAIQRLCAEAFIRRRAYRVHLCRMDHND